MGGGHRRLLFHTCLHTRGLDPGQEFGIHTQGGNTHADQKKERLISRPLVNTSLILKDISEGEGDLTKRIDLTAKDETGDLAKFFNRFIDKLQQMILSIGDNAPGLTQSAADMTVESEKMNSEVENMSAKTDNVNTPALQMNENVQSIASAMEQTTTNVSIIANSAEGVSATINEIAENTRKPGPSVKRLRVPVQRGHGKRQ